MQLDIHFKFTDQKKVQNGVFKQLDSSVGLIDFSEEYRPFCSIYGCNLIQNTLTLPFFQVNLETASLLHDVGLLIQNGHFEVYLFVCFSIYRVFPAMMFIRLDFHFSCLHECNTVNDMHVISSMMLPI